jgi:hypothetical protein
MQKKINELKQEHGKCGTSQCKWPWFERCLVIWGKIILRLETLQEARGAGQAKQLDIKG